MPILKGWWFYNGLFWIVLKARMVPGAGLEPARSYDRGILNPLCLPISPPGHRGDTC